MRYAPGEAPLPSADLLRELLSYDPETGIFRWRAETRPCRPIIGSVAGTNRRGYTFIGVRGFPQIGAHRLAWIYVHGRIPDGMAIDHIDRNPSNNAIANLRLATSSEQRMNSGVQSNNRSGLKGAFYHDAHKGKKWRTQIKVRGELKFLGYFATAEEAHEVYKRAANENFGEFSPHRGAP